MWRSAHLKEGWRRADGALSAITGMAEISRCERGQRTDGGHWGKSTSVWIIQAARKLQGRLRISPERTDKNNNPPDCLHMQTNRLQLEFKDRLKEMWLERWLVFVIFCTTDKFKFKVRIQSILTHACSEYGSPRNKAAKEAKYSKTFTDRADSFASKKKRCCVKC